MDRDLLLIVKRTAQLQRIAIVSPIATSQSQTRRRPIARVPTSDARRTFWKTARRGAWPDIQGAFARLTRRLPFSSSINGPKESTSDCGIHRRVHRNPSHRWRRDQSPSLLPSRIPPPSHELDASRLSSLLTAFAREGHCGRRFVPHSLLPCAIASKKLSMPLTCSGRYSSLVKVMKKPESPLLVLSL